MFMTNIGEVGASLCCGATWKLVMRSFQCWVLLPSSPSISHHGSSGSGQMQVHLWGETHLGASVMSTS
jgi:hypothetical protein